MKKILIVLLCSFHSIVPMQEPESLGWRVQEQAWSRSFFGWLRIHTGSRDNAHCALRALNAGGESDEDYSEPDLDNHPGLGGATESSRSTDDDSDDEDFYPIEKKKTFVCEQCGKEFKSHCGLRYHILSKHEGQTWPCPQCGQVFSYPSARDNHIRSKHR